MIRMTPSRRRGPLACLVVMATMLMSLGFASAATADVDWTSEILQAPTNLPPGGQGMLRVHGSNEGDTSSTEFPTITVDLPAGVTLAPGHENNYLWSCTGAGTSQVTCTHMLAFLPIPAHKFVGLGTIPWYLHIVVDVAPDAAEGVAPVVVTMAGGGGETDVMSHDIAIGAQQLPFGPAPGTFTAGAFNRDGTPFTQAGGHPYQATTSFRVNTKYAPPTPGNDTSYADAIMPVATLKDIVVDLPAGFTGNPTTGAKCPNLGAVVRMECPAASQVGVAAISPGIAAFAARRMMGVYSIVPDKDTPAQFAFLTPMGPVLMTPVVRSDGDLGLSVHVKHITQADVLLWSSVTLWGVPADPSHDAQRCAQPNYHAQACIGYDEGGSPPPFGDEGTMTAHTSNEPLEPFLSLPTHCSGQPVPTALHLTSWADPGRYEPDRDPDLGDPSWVSASTMSPPVTGCDRLRFDPAISVRPTSSGAGAPSGLEFDLSLPQNDDPEGVDTAHMRDVSVTLPEGMTVNASSAAGLDACGSAQIGLTSSSPVRFSKAEPGCPLASKIGTLEVDTPLLDDPLHGDVFLARQGDNPFGSLLAMYMVVRGPGILVKLAGHVQADAATGRLTTTVIDNPQLPVRGLKLRLKSGPQAPLTTPRSCGPKTVSATLSSWAGHSVAVEDSFAVDCPGNSDRFDPGFTAGSTSVTAGAFSPFAVRVTRDSGGKELGRVNVRMPKGLLARLKGVGVCGESQLAAAAGRSGSLTRGASVCPASSRIGTVTVGAGAGDPFYPLIPGSDVSGRVFLTGAHTKTPYSVAGARQADYGLAIEVPAVAGPFDLGTVLVRAAIFVDPVSAELTVLSDQMPRILQGIPLDVRDIRIDVDRRGFAVNPTSCKEKEIVGDLRAQDGTRVLREVRFQVGDCAALGFKPRLGMRLTGRGQTKTGRHPGLRAVVRQGRGQAGINRADVTLPSSLALDTNNAGALCEFEDGIKPDLENHCPKASKVGRARAVSPLLKRPLSGDVFFVKNVRTDKRTGNKIRTLPMIVVALRGEVDVNLRGKSNVRKGRLVNTFAAVPDAPISQFNLRINGGAKGILQVTATRRGKIDICRSKQVAQARMAGQNGKRHNASVRIKTPCATKKRKLRLSS